MFQVIGPVSPPPGVITYGADLTGLTNFISVIYKTLIVIAGLYTLFNIILAGYAFLSAGDDSKKITDAWAKIWQSVLGLAITSAALILGAIIGYLLFRDFSFLILPRFYGPD